VFVCVGARAHNLTIFVCVWGGGCVNYYISYTGIIIHTNKLSYYINRGISYSLYFGTLYDRLYIAKFHLLETSAYTNKYILRSTIVATNKNLHMLTAVRLKSISTFNISLNLINEMCKEINFIRLNSYLSRVKVVM